MSFYRYFVIICEGNERAGQGGEEKDISRRDCASSGGGSLARREYLFPHPAHFGSRYLSLGREICLILKKVDSKQRVNNVSITHGKTAPVL